MVNQKQQEQRLRGWVIWTVAGFFVFYQFLIQNSLGVMSHPLMRDFQIDAAGVGFLSSSFFYTYLVLQVPAGLLVDRLGPKWLLVYGCLACAGATVLFASTSLFSVAMTSRMIMGFVTAPAVASVMYLAFRHLPPRLFGLAAGLMEMMGMLGGMGEAGLGQCVEWFGWRHALFGFAGLGVILALLMILILPSRHNSLQKTAHKAAEKTQVRMLECLWAVIQQPQAWIAGLIAGLAFTVVTALAGLWCVPYLEILYHISEAKAAYGSAAIFLGAAIGAPTLGAIGARVPHCRTYMATFFFISTVLLFLMIHSPPSNFPLMLVLLLMTGFCSGIYIVPFTLIRYFTPPFAQATAIGFMNMMLILIGSPILQPLIGKLLNGHAVNGHLTVADYRFALNTLLVCFCMALVLIERIRLPETTGIVGESTA